MLSVALFDHLVEERHPGIDLAGHYEGAAHGP
jgi:hypothetical protein